MKKAVLFLSVPGKEEYGDKTLILGLSTKIRDDIGTEKAGGEVFLKFNLANWKNYIPVETEKSFLKQNLVKITAEIKKLGAEVGWDIYPKRFIPLESLLNPISVLYDYRL